MHQERTEEWDPQGSVSTGCGGHHAISRVPSRRLLPVALLDLSILWILKHIPLLDSGRCSLCSLPYFHPTSLLMHFSLPSPTIKKGKYHSGEILNYLQFSSVTQSCPILCNPMDYSTSGFPVHHQFPELAQTHVH